MKSDMPKPKKNRAPANITAANVGYEAELWQMADALRGSMDAAEYKHVVLRLIFLRDDKRWQYGVPPAANANSAWVSTA